MTVLDAFDLAVCDDAQLGRRAAAGDPRARHELIERYLPLARGLALRYRRSGEPLDARAIDARVAAPQGPAVRLVLVAAHAACDICDQPTMVRAVRARADREPRCADRHRSRTGGGSGRLSRDSRSVLLAPVAGLRVAA